MPKYLLFLVQQHLNFRKAELESLADLYNINLDFSTYSDDSPFFIVDLPNDETASKLVERSILSKGIYELYAQDKNYELLHSRLSENNKVLDEIESAYKSSTFKFDFQYYGGKKKYTKSTQIKKINEFTYLPLKGTIDLRSPQVTFTILEYFEMLTPQKSKDEPSQIFFTRLVSPSLRTRGDTILDIYALKNRPFRGTTSFEAELSLVTCNISQVKPFCLMYDPFVGTGSFLVTAAEFGALCLGSDIDGRMIRGNTLRTPSTTTNDVAKYITNGISQNFEYYGKSLQLLDVMTMDFTHNALKSDLVIDCIICDPPYGIREGIKVLGSKVPNKIDPTIIKDGVLAYLHKDYIPTKKPYSLDLLLDELLDFASQRLSIGGRLCFWMPTANSCDIETIIPLHKNLELKYNCVQNFNKWSRRLLCYINRGNNYNGPCNIGKTRINENFRDQYFKGFN
ncbi:related to tRNA (guanine(10)-N2)-methyltransferase [Saccharomycodes ludwigii]|uniref:tRNA (guanine(10)-N(2))-methyltransferase n=1 Tax=Saccharomycodes ludwigii TaxID=36035 RepID=A0A376B6S4_9ASCO|nr:hypothetical protein SCDLUD_004693 [Saccharomycodes ludwigii]KAH3899258.1 hypothetical protein SCDLUD_004693 [Saccharomycodes ludwigii]SSD59800.1 related to tRNA (guanine(10)-N2)-methyltransferase [Saccharomycodes ludwigii]